MGQPQKTLNHLLSQNVTLQHHKLDPACLVNTHVLLWHPSSSWDTSDDVIIILVTEYRDWEEQGPLTLDGDFSRHRGSCRSSEDKYITDWRNISLHSWCNTNQQWLQKVLDYVSIKLYSCWTDVSLDMCYTQVVFEKKKEISGKGTHQ